LTRFDCVLRPGWKQRDGFPAGARRQRHLWADISGTAPSPVRICGKIHIYARIEIVLLLKKVGA